MSENKPRVNNKLLEYIAVLAVVVFAGVMAYAIRTASNSVAGIQQGHYEVVDIDPQSPSVKEPAASDS